MFGKRSGGKTLKKFAVAVPWCVGLCVISVYCHGSRMGCGSGSTLELIFMLFCDVAAWRMAGQAQTEGCSHFSVLVLGVILLSSGSRKSLTLDLVSFLFKFFLEFGCVSWTAAPGTGA